MHQQGRWSLLCVCLFLSAVLPLPAQKQDKTTSSASDTIEGAKIFQYRCAVCHGADGRGHGPDSVVLNHTVPDLTLISQSSGGKFPYQRVRGIIEGQERGVSAHVDREMPIWGPIFHEVELDQDWGEVRLDAITKYAESIQKSR